MMESILIYYLFLFGIVTLMLGGFAFFIFLLFYYGGLALEKAFSQKDKR